jgi:predicted DNA-binding antitoxin AbrB/MazE fold protein
MTTRATAVYENGVLRPTSPLRLKDGDRIEFTFDVAIESRLGDQAQMAQKFDALANLADGWNGYTAPRPSPTAQRNARDLFDEACNRGMVPTRIEPSAMGGVGITFAAGNREAVAELYNNGTAHALFADDSSEEMDTQSIAPTAEGYRAFLDEVCRYLYGQAPAR